MFWKNRGLAQLRDINEQAVINSPDSTLRFYITHILKEWNCRSVKIKMESSLLFRYWRMIKNDYDPRSQVPNRGYCIEWDTELKKTKKPPNFFLSRKTSLRLCQRNWNICRQDWSPAGLHIWGIITGWTIPKWRASAFGMQSSHKAYNQILKTSSQIY